MKKIMLESLMIVLSIVGCLFFSEKSEAAVNVGGSVTINAKNFPDERFRYFAKHFDINNDNILSLEERSVLKELVIENRYLGLGDEEDISYTSIGDFSSRKAMQLVCTDSTKNLSIKGIEYFPELRSYTVIGYLQTEGALKKNTKLTSICLAMPSGEIKIIRDEDNPFQLITSKKLEKDFPMKQLKTIKIDKGLKCKKLSLKNAKKLEELEIGSIDIYEDYMSDGKTQIGKLDLSTNKKLKKLTLRANKDMKIKVNREWYKKYGKKKLSLYDGKMKTSMKIFKKTKRYLYLKAK